MGRWDKVTKGREPDHCTHQIAREGVLPIRDQPADPESNGVPWLPGGVLYRTGGQCHQLRGCSGSGAGKQEKVEPPGQTVGVGQTVSSQVHVLVWVCEHVPHACM